ncbi:Hypothetical predicted protein [Pelobates cultripes]|uniref:Uncharacterized protein n=1 Tax=Pelobates cultripes TaxID=61616 RepID=A0AAD1T7B4_PELCU|nr:Hypothetical predicted protein [Pelobates cultripes]
MNSRCCSDIQKEDLKPIKTCSQHNKGNMSYRRGRGERGQVNFDPRVVQANIYLYSLPYEGFRGYKITPDNHRKKQSNLSPAKLRSRQNKRALTNYFPDSSLFSQNDIARDTTTFGRKEEPNLSLSKKTFMEAHESIIIIGKRGHSSDLNCGGKVSSLRTSQCGRCSWVKSGFHSEITSFVMQTQLPLLNKLLKSNEEPSVYPVCQSSVDLLCNLDSSSSTDTEDSELQVSHFSADLQYSIPRVNHISTKRNELTHLPKSKNIDDPQCVQSSSCVQNPGFMRTNENEITVNKPLAINVYSTSLSSSKVSSLYDHNLGATIYNMRSLDLTDTENISCSPCTGEEKDASMAFNKPCTNGEKTNFGTFKSCDTLIERFTFPRKLRDDQKSLEGVTNSQCCWNTPISNLPDTRPLEREEHLTEIADTLEMYGQVSRGIHSVTLPMDGFKKYPSEQRDAGTTSRYPEHPRWPSGKIDSGEPRGGTLNQASRTHAPTRTQAILGPQNQRRTQIKCLTLDPATSAAPGTSSQPLLQHKRLRYCTPRKDTLKLTPEAEIQGAATAMKGLIATAQGFCQR